MRNNTLRLLFIALLLPVFTFAGNENLPIGARSSAIGHASLNVQDIWSIYHNQAGLANLEKIGGGIYYESRFTMKELSLKGGVVAIPTKFGTFGVSVTSFGYKLYNESKYGLAYGMKLGDKLRGGVQLNYHQTRLGEGYGNFNAISGEIGLQADISDEFSIGAHVYNPTFTKMAEYNNERIPTALRLGAMYKVNKKVFFAAEAYKNIYDRASFRAGIEYQVVDILYLRGGIGTEPTLASFGFGLKLKNFFVDVASSYHSTLGFSPQVSISYNPF